MPHSITIPIGFSGIYKISSKKKMINYHPHKMIKKAKRQRNYHPSKHVLISAPHNTNQFLLHSYYEDNACLNPPSKKIASETCYGSMIGFVDRCMFEEFPNDFSSSNSIEEEIKRINENCCDEKKYELVIGHYELILKEQQNKIQELESRLKEIEQRNIHKEDEQDRSSNQGKNA